MSDRVQIIADAFDEVEEVIKNFRDKMHLDIVGGRLPVAYCLVVVTGLEDGEDMTLDTLAVTKGHIPVKELASFNDCLLQAIADDMNDTGVNDAKT